ncbi:MAG: hypothetical protein GX061_01420 [Eubacteriaceae bacterium]|nr:hypothetical protein [Eubacteriaceae bacterium]
MEISQRYAYNQLDGGEKLLYERLCGELMRLSGEIELTCGEETLLRVLRAVIRDFPEMFWFEGKVALSENSFGQTVLCPQYIMDNMRQINSCREIIAARMNEIVFPENSSDYEKALAAALWLCENVQYSPGTALSGQNILSVFIDKKSVCKGIAKAYQYILGSQGILCTLKEGSLDGKALHIWNGLQIDKEFYNVDITMGFTPFRDYWREASESFEESGFFCVSDETLSFSRILFEDSFICPRDYDRKAAK